jgi:acyl-coenzyme A thioesterase PaaI-like protein
MGDEFVPRGPRRELTRLIRQIQALTLELDALRLRGGRDGELRAKERALERLRWRLAAVARHAATDDPRPAA